MRRLLAWLERPRWAVVVYQAGERVCVMECFIFRSSADVHARMLDTLSRERYPRTQHLVERINGRPHVGERCVS